MTRRTTRRELLATLGGMVVASRMPRAAPATPAAFPFHDVRLLDGPFLDAQKRDLDYLVSLQPDRMLHNFRVNAGLEPQGACGRADGNPKSRRWRSAATVTRSVTTSPRYPSCTRRPATNG